MQFLNLVSASLRELKALVRCWSSCEAVSERLREGRGNAYFVQLGFNLRELIDVEILEGYLSVWSRHSSIEVCRNAPEAKPKQFDFNLRLSHSAASTHADASRPGQDGRWIRSWHRIPPIPLPSNPLRSRNEPETNMKILRVGIRSRRWSCTRVYG